MLNDTDRLTLTELIQELLDRLTPIAVKRLTWRLASDWCLDICEAKANDWRGWRGKLCRVVDAVYGLPWV